MKITLTPVTKEEVKRIEECILEKEEKIEALGVNATITGATEISRIEAMVEELANEGFTEIDLKVTFSI